jgi:hypothetical protein
VKFLFLLLLIAATILGGCATKPEPATKVFSNHDSGLLVTPEHLLAGKVAVYNVAGRFVVLDFPVGWMPVIDQTMFVYRQGLKVGVVKITGPVRDTNTVGDLVSGEAQKGDEVRDR